MKISVGTDIIEIDRIKEINILQEHFQRELPKEKKEYYMSSRKRCYY